MFLLKNMFSQYSSTKSMIFKPIIERKLYQNELYTKHEAGKATVGSEFFFSKSVSQSCDSVDFLSFCPVLRWLSRFLILSCLPMSFYYF